MMKPAILCIEDNSDNMMLVRRLLQVRVDTLLEAHTGLDGLSIAETQDVDLILLDINLPDIDGYEVADRLRRSAKHALASNPHHCTYGQCNER